MQQDKVLREHYTYEKNGSCALLAAIEPLTGKRVAAVYERRTKKEYALFLKALAKAYPEAVKIRLVQDNLSTIMPVRFMRPFRQKKPLLCRSVLSFITPPSPPPGST